MKNSSAQTDMESDQNEGIKALSHKKDEHFDADYVVAMSIKAECFSFHCQQWHHFYWQTGRVALGHINSSTESYFKKIVALEKLWICQR